LILLPNPNSSIDLIVVTVYEFRDSTPSDSAIITITVLRTDHAMQLFPDKYLFHRLRGSQVVEPREGTVRRF
jgi:hypothetical protein